MSISPIHSSKTISHDSHVLQQLSKQFETLSPKEILNHAYQHDPNTWISFSGAEDMVLIHFAAQVVKRPKVFSLDTGRLHKETYEFIEQVRQHYDIELEILFPRHEKVQELVQNKGLFSFYDDGHKECCQVRKVEPLKRKLGQINTWVTGQRRDQSVDTRSALASIEIDPAFSTPDSPLLKFNPLANWSSERIWSFIRENDIPFNALHQKGFTSIGCEPCTRAILPNQHEREGRWWWESSEAKECGLHAAKERKRA